MAHTRGKRKDDWTLEIFLIFNVEQLSIKKKNRYLQKNVYLHIQLKREDKLYAIHLNMSVILQMLKF